MIRFLRAAAFAGACLLNSAAGAAGNERPTATELVAPAAFEEPALSPDGKRVAARETVAGVPRIVILDLAAPGKRASFALPAGQKLGWVRWAGNDRLLLSVEKGENVTRLATLDPATGRETPIELPRQTAEGDHVLHVDPAGTFLLLSAQASETETPAVWRIDLESGAAAMVVRPQKGVWDWYADSAGVVRAGVGEKGRERFLVYRASEGERFRRRGGGDVSNSGADELVPVAGSDSGYAIAGTREGRYALFRYDFAADRLGAKVYENGQVDVDSFQTSPQGKLLGVTYTDDRERYDWFDPAMKAAQARIDKALPGAVNRILSAGDAREHMLVASASATDPGSYHLYDAATGRVTPLAAAYPELAGKTLSDATGAMRRATGSRSSGYLTLPAGRAAMACR
jgi:hypothetical protein